MKKTRIKITHQIDKTVHHFLVVNPDRLLKKEVEKICNNMNVSALFVNGKLYKK